MSISLSNVSKDTSDTQYEICPTMNIISTIYKKTLTNYRINWEKIYELPTNELYPITYKGDGKFFILVDDEMNLVIYDTNKGQLISSIDNSRKLELISWKECFNGDIVDNDSMFEYIEKSLPLLTSVSYSILEDKKKFDFIIYGGENVLNLSIFGIFNIENLIKLDGIFLAHICNDDNIIENYILSQIDNDLVIYKLEIDFLKSYPNLNHLSLICSKISKFFGALSNAFDEIQKESKIYIDHTRKLINLLKDETLNHLDELYDILLTGMMSKGVHTWLTDYLGAVGLTRWKLLGLKCFQQVRSLIFTRIIPLIERLILNYTNFTTLIVNKSQDQIITKLQSLLKQVFLFVNDLNNEFKNFNKFIEWLNLVLKDLNEDLSDEKKQDILKSLSHVNIDTITEFINKNLGQSCILRHMDAKSSIMLLSRDLKVFINAKFSILKMEIKKNLHLGGNFKIPNTNIEFFDYIFTHISGKLYIITLLNTSLNILTTDLIESSRNTIEFTQPICKIKKTTTNGVISVLSANKWIKVDISTGGICHETILNQKGFTLYNMASNNQILVIVDRSQHLILPSE